MARKNYSLLFIPKEPSWFDELPIISNSSIIGSYLDLGKFKTHSVYEYFGLKEQHLKNEGASLEEGMLFSENGLFSESYFDFNGINEISVSKDNYDHYMEKNSDRRNANRNTANFLDDCARIKLCIPYIEIGGSLLIRYFLNIELGDYYAINEGYKVVVLNPIEHKELSIGSVIDFNDYLSKYYDVIIDDSFGCNYYRYFLKNINLIEEKQKILLNKEIKVGITPEKVLDIIDDLIEKNIKPEWLIYENLIVVAPKFRPLVYEGDRIREYELDKINGLYLKIIEFNNRYYQMQKGHASFILLQGANRIFDQLISDLYVELTKYYTYDVKFINTTNGFDTSLEKTNVLNSILLKDYVSAESTLLKMCENNDTDAMLMLCDLYSEKFSIDNIEKKHKYLELASSLGNDKAKRRLIEAYLFREFKLTYEYDKVKQLIFSLKDSRIKKAYISIIDRAKPKTEQEINESLLKAIFGEK